MHNRFILSGSINVKHQHVLELGSGTGMAGIVAAKQQAASVVLTDYQPQILENLHYNVSANISDDLCRVQVQKLDWNDALSHSDNPINNPQYPVILAADVCYQMEHGQSFAKTCKHHLMPASGRAHIILCLRDKFQKDIEYWEECMVQSGLMLEYSEIIKEDDWSNIFSFEGPESGFKRYIYSNSK